MFVFLPDIAVTREKQLNFLKVWFVMKIKRLITSLMAGTILVFAFPMLLCSCDGINDFLNAISDELESNILDNTSADASGNTNTDMKTSDFRLVKELTLAPVTDEDDKNVYSVLRGGCSDGENLYFALNTDSVTPLTAIVKVSPDTGDIIAFKTGISADNATDLCFDPATGYIIVAHGAPNRQKISFFDADTLEFICDKSIFVQIDSITNDSSSGNYYVGIDFGCNFACLDSEFNVINTFIGIESDSFRNSIDFKDGNIIFAMSEPARICAYTSDGKPLSDIPLKTTDCQIANISHIGDNWYLGMIENTETDDGIQKSAVIRIYTSVPAESSEETSVVPSISDTESAGSADVQN